MKKGKEKEMNIINIVELLFFFAVVGFFLRKLSSEYGDEVNSKPKTKKQTVIHLVDKEESDVMSKIKEIDPSFNEEDFLTGAKEAFKMIVGAFNRGSLDEVKNYISHDIWQSFDNVVSERKAKGVTSFFELIAFTKAAVKDIKLTGNIASVTVDFESEQESYTTDAEGKVLSGSSNQVVKIADIWTFTRDLKSKDPNWVLTATQN